MSRLEEILKSVLAHHPRHKNQVIPEAVKEINQWIEEAIGENKKPNPNALRGELWTEARNSLRAEIRAKLGLKENKE